MTDSNPKRRFEFKSDKSYKFWTFQQVERVVEITYGRIGNKGTPSEKRFDTVEQATKFAQKKIAEKLKAGYKEHVKKKIERKSNAELWQELEPHEPFFQAILKNPDDQDGYLVYADWLMERGDPRGEYIHCQWKIADYDTPLWEVESLEKRANEIHSEHWRDWVDELARFFSDSKIILKFDRGFIDKISISCTRSVLAECLRDSPHTRMARELIVLNNTSTSEGMTSDFRLGMEILAETDFGNVRHLSPGMRVASQQNRPVLDLIQSMPRLEKLTLNDSFFENDLKALYQIRLPTLKHLRIVEQNGGVTVMQLCKSNWLEQLQTIELVCNLSDVVCQRLAESLDPNQIETLYVSHSISEESINLFEKHDINVIPD